MRGALTRFLTAPVTRRQLPVWAELILGVGCVIAGAALTLRPFTSLGVLVLLIAICAIATGIAELAAASQATSPRLAQAAGVGWIVAGVAVAVWAGLTIRGIAVWVGV